MKRTLALATVCMLFGVDAFADHRGGGVVVRDHRGPGPGAVVVRDHRGPAPGPVVRDHRGPVYSHVRVSGGRYTFPGGVVRVYHQPVIRERYYNIHVRPPLLVESYEPVPGYVWMRGSWTWGGAEWVWTPGYWAAAQEPVVTGGVGFSAGVTF